VVVVVVVVAVVHVECECHNTHASDSNAELLAFSFSVANLSADINPTASFTFYVPTVWNICHLRFVRVACC